MAVLGPFETRPHLAAAISGGPDSVALMRLLVPWCAERLGRFTALTVDHGLRAEAADEARQVGAWALALGADAVTLTWRGQKPASGLQAAARAARYDLLLDWCRSNGVLHLALGHQADDQRETVAMRQSRLKGDAAPTLGLAGMSLVAPRGGVRLLRPLLQTPRSVIIDFLRALGQDWIEDPSNDLETYERIRWRRGRLGALPDLGTIRAAGRARQGLESAAAGLLARSATIVAAGHAFLDPAALSAADPEVSSLAIGQVLTAVGGTSYRPAAAALLRDLQGVLVDGRTRSLAGCLLGRWRGRVMICREAARTAGSLRLATPGRHIWDHRFAIDLSEGAPRDLTIAALGETGLRDLDVVRDASLDLGAVPAPARASLPACRDATGRLIHVPFIGFDPFGLNRGVIFRFRPNNSATSSGFTVA